MKYTDEEILKKREEKKKQQQQTLEQGKYIQGRTVKFKEQTVLDRYTILLPEVWMQMPPELARIKYPSEFRPECILTNKDLSVNMGFSFFPQEQQVTDTEKMTRSILETIFNQNSNLIFIKFSELMEINGHWFAYRSHAMDSDLFNQLSIIAIGQTIIMSNFNCLYEHGTDWENTVLMMWDSMKEIKKEVQKI